MSDYDKVMGYGDVPSYSMIWCDWWQIKPDVNHSQLKGEHRK